MPVYKKPMGREEEGMRLRRRLPQVRARVRLLRRGLRLGVVVGGGRSRIRGCLSGIRVRRRSGRGRWVWGFLCEWCGDGDGDGDGVIDAMTLTLGAAMTYPHKTRQERPTLENKTLDKIKPTDKIKLSNDKTRQNFLFFLACYVHAFCFVSI